MATEEPPTDEAPTVPLPVTSDKSRLCSTDEIDLGQADMPAMAEVDENTGARPSNSCAVCIANELRGSAFEWLSTLVQEMPDLTKRDYEVLHDDCGVYSEPNIHYGRIIGLRSVGDRVSGCQITVHGWLKLDNEEGWMATDLRCLSDDEETSDDLMRPVIPPGDAVQELVVSDFYPQGICCLEVVFQQAIIRRLPHRQALPLGSCREGELVFASSQNFDGWVRLVSPEGWMLVHAQEHGDLLRARSPEDVADIDLLALCEIWMTVRRTHIQPLQQEMVDGLKDLERRASRAAAEMIFESENNSRGVDHAPEAETQHSFNKRRRGFFVKASMDYLREEQQWAGIWQGTIDHHGKRCAISHDNVVYECASGEAIGVWDADSTNVIEVPVISVDGRACLVAPNCAVYDLATREVVGVFNYEKNTVECADEEEGADETVESAAAESAGEEEAEGAEEAAETVDEEGESSNPLSASVSEGIDAGREVSASISSELHVTQSPPQEVTPRMRVEHPLRTENLSMQLPMVEQALRFAEECDAAEKEISSPETIWSEVVKLGPLLLWTAQPEFELPQHFSKATTTCMSFLPNVLAEPFHSVGQIVELFEMPDIGQILHYFDWLELVIRELGKIDIASGRNNPNLQCLQRDLPYWPIACALVQRSAAALWEAILGLAPGFLNNIRQWEDIRKAKKDLQDSSASVGHQMVEQLKAAAAGLAAELQDKQGVEWTELAEKTQATLKQVKQLTTGFLEGDQQSIEISLSEVRDFRKRADECDLAVILARRQVKQHYQAFRQAVDRFIESGQEIIAWARVVVPKLRLLGQHSKVLRKCADLQKRLPELENQKLAAEDELDMAVMELRRFHRRLCGSHASRSIKAPAKDTVEKIIESRLELNKQRLEGRVRQLEMALRATEEDFQVAVRELPIPVEINIGGGVSSAEDPSSIECEDPSI